MMWRVSILWNQRKYIRVKRGSLLGEPSVEALCFLQNSRMVGADLKAWTESDFCCCAYYWIVSNTISYFALIFWPRRPAAWNCFLHRLTVLHLLDDALNVISTNSQYTFGQFYNARKLTIRQTYFMTNRSSSVRYRFKPCPSSERNNLP